MSKGFSVFIKYLDLFATKVGKTVSWSSFLLAVLIAIDVIIRYVFDFTFIWMIELEIYFYGILILMGSAYTFKYQKHVRVDVFYTKMNERSKAVVDLLGSLLLLIPWCYVVIVSSWYYGYSSFLINESSAQAGGLPALYVLKFCITLGFIFLLLQGISEILKALRVLLFKES